MVCVKVKYPLTPHKGTDCITYFVYGKAPKGQLHGTPIAISGSGHAGYKVKSLKLSSIGKSAPQERLLLVVGR